MSARILTGSLSKTKPPKQRRWLIVYVAEFGHNTAAVSLYGLIVCSNTLAMNTYQTKLLVEGALKTKPPKLRDETMILQKIDILLKLRV